MFTGIIEEVGTIAALEMQSAGALLKVRCRAVIHDTALGASIAVNGACVTAVALGEDWFSADLSPETLTRTNLGALHEGSRVNLERPVRATGRLEGHFVLGHVDGTGEIVALDGLGNENWWLQIRVPDGLTRYVVSKGSIAVDGMSLTVAEIEGSLVGSTIIPHTYSHTSLSSYGVGARVNIEVDILAKHLERLTWRE